MSNIGVGRRLITVFCAFPLLFSVLCVAGAATVQEQSPAPKASREIRNCQTGRHAAEF